MNEIYLSITDGKIKVKYTILVSTDIVKLFYINIFRVSSKYMFYVSENFTNKQLRNSR